MFKFKRTIVAKVIATLLVLLSFNGVTFAAAGMSESDSNNSASTATAIPADYDLTQEIAAAIESAGDVDYYKFIPLNSGGYSIETLGTTDTFGYLYDSDMNLLDVSNDQIYPNGINMELRYELTANCTYYVKVVHNDAAGTGNYNLKITPVIYSNKEIESNDSFETATSPTWSKCDYPTAATIGTAGDQDFYRFETSSSGSFTFETIGSTDTYGYLYDSNHNLLASDNDSGEANNMKIVYNMSGYQVYYLKICHASSSGTGSYGLKMSPPDTASTTPDWEGSNFDSATQLTTENYVKYSGLGINNANDTDFFTFTPSADGIYTFQSTGSFNVKGEVYNNDYTLIKSDDNSGEHGNFMVYVPLTANQTYYLKVDASEPGTIGNYGLDIAMGRCLPVPIYLQQPFDNLCWAASAAMAISYFNNDTINRSTDIAKSYAQSNCGGFQTSLGPDYYNYPSVFNRQAYLTDCNEYLSGYTIPQVQPSTLDYTGSGHPNDQFQYTYTANTLKKSIDNGYPMLVRVRNAAGGYHMMVIKGYKECADGINVIYNDPLYGEYMTQIGSPETWGYTTFYSRYQDIEPNDSKDDAIIILDQTFGSDELIAPTQGSIGKSGDVDYYTFSAQHNDLYFIQITGMAGTCIELYNESETQPIELTTINDGDQGSNIVYHLGVREKYYIKVKHSGSGTGSYTLKVSHTIPMD